MENLLHIINLLNVVHLCRELQQYTTLNFSELFPLCIFYLHSYFVTML